MNKDEVLNKLKEDYNLRSMLIKKNYDVPDELEDEIEDLEQSVITSKVIPELERYAKELLQNLECEVCLGVLKDGNGDVRVENEYVDWMPVPFHEDTVETVGVSEDEVEYTGKKITRSPHTGICVYYSETDYIQEKTAADTFVTAIVKAGLPDVENLKIIKEKGFLVSKDKNPNAHSPLHKVGEYYINTHSSTQEKKGFLERISNALNLGWRIEIVK